jgi:hypothetical protein
VAKFSHAAYIDPNQVLAATTNGSSGTELRTPDGVHLTSAGGTLLATAVINDVQHRWPGLLGTVATVGSQP